MKTALFTLLTALALSSQAEDVTLKGGAHLQAPLLKNTSDAIVLDLGYDVLRIPREEVLAIHEEQQQAVTGVMQMDTNRLYTMQSPARITTAEAVKR